MSGRERKGGNVRKILNEEIKSEDIKKLLLFEERERENP
jgi:hypothetical protein